MIIQRLYFIPCILLLAFIPKSYASPIQQDENTFTSKLPVVSILRTVLLGYMTHILTIRPRTGVTDFPTVLRRISALIYPSSGIGTAVESIYKALRADKILGIAQFEPFLKQYKEEEEESKDKKTKDKGSDSLDSLDSTNTTALSSSLVTSESMPEHKKDIEYDAKTLGPSDIYSNASQLRDRLIKDAKAAGIEIKDHDNAPYLAAFLHVLGPDKAKKTKSCILNRSVTVGFNKAKTTVRMVSSCVAEEISVAGPGAVCENQAEILPKVFRYMTDSMIAQLEPAHNMDDTSFIAIFVTVGQLFFTTIECMDIDGDRWAKVIIIIFTTMSILQTFSLLVLHKQTMTFSIKDEDDEKILLKYDSLVLTEKELKDFGDKNEDLEDNEEVVIYSTLTGTIAFLLIGVWADYTIHSTTEWLVISWIISPMLFIFGIIIGVVLDFTNKVVATILFTCIIIGSIGCLTAATIIGYLPK
ncbi:hypothetical protein J3Q64DRAFT_1771098 [Phycomyces blakesleeanus]|uniref:Uncharacterized protein n=2 Tax=Phycomyces blakesleeanus TaxID=4837 RepID=A0A167L9X9_PHYB8|nr:hypothetical protein PHYBLDRAFT_171958 [Phycomyces blakesleeanus NRRL 1555(-)]OAD69935.1 hypothetical protein PHYBLDRAFT_171958 [Phycomyces blakesleeanus NRRL 1555(-)]|eukprot:XP_018287975.1 hypothetical protein PHYBLDRAFT_171958 [Phycomyces blakesleeanus NRRL 1555(-)]